MLSAKEELEHLTGLLSEYECALLVSTMRDTVAGQRFWEGDAGTLYNERIKLRHSRVRRKARPSGELRADATSAAPAPGIYQPVPIVKFYPNAKRTALPPSERLETGLTRVIERRRSRREYNGDSISLQALSTLLQHSCGATGVTDGYGYDRLSLRAFPSSGGLQAPEVYVSAQSIKGLPSGLYHYQAAPHALDLLREGNQGPRLREFAFDEAYLETAAAVVIVTGCYSRLRWKYGEGAYRYMCIDAGFLSENLYLAVEGLNLGACAISGFAEDAVEELLGIDGRDEIALLLMTVGVGP
jgi:SagB-type dehydrogenase family enzyme